MIEVTAKLLRGVTYLSGETIECCITFRNPSPSPHARSQCNRDVLEILAWASAQIHCHCTVNEGKVRYPQDGSVSPEETAITNTETSFAPCRGERGRVVLSTKPKILFCDIRLLPGESRSFMYREVLPSEGPPSFKGQAVKYSYKITVGTQRVNSCIKLLRVPLRVLVLQGIVERQVYGENEDLTPSNPFLESQPRESPLDAALETLQSQTCRRHPNVYNVTNARGRVVRFSLFKPGFRLGEDIVGTFDFSGATVPTVQFSVTLQSQEVVAQAASRSHSPLTQDGGVGGGGSGETQGTIVSYSKYHEVCLRLSHTHVVLPVPLHVTPGFATNIVSLRWRLHFEFVTTTQPSTLGSENQATWQGPRNLDIETMVWNLPIQIHPTVPVHLAQGLPLPSEYSITI